MAKPFSPRKVVQVVEDLLAGVDLPLRGEA